MNQIRTTIEPIPNVMGTLALLQTWAGIAALCQGWFFGLGFVFGWVTRFYSDVFAESTAMPHMGFF